MDKWVKYRKGHTNVAYTPDIIIASILRLIGETRLSLSLSLSQGGASVLPSLFLS